MRLASAGLQVDAVDISDVAVTRGRSEASRLGLELTWHVADLDEFTPAHGRYQVITVIRYRNRELWPRLVDALAPGGWLLAEHHFKTTAPVAAC
jgi:protein-L-isoaspartate O-methyltransferase